MKISIICSSTDHPIFPYLQKWVERNEIFHKIELANSKLELTGGDVLFLISCNQIIGSDVRSKFKATLVIHASDLPYGRGWSPHIWQILQGRACITVSLLEAEDAVDSGAIWAQRTFELEGHELFDEINAKLFQVEFELMDFVLSKWGRVKPQSQRDEKPSYFRKRTTEDSQVNPEESIVSQFNLLRVTDPLRFPAFFDYLGYRYRIEVKKVKRLDE